MEAASEAGRCVTCGDLAVPARIVALLDEGAARVEADGAVTDISVELVDAGVGDLVLVHAGVAIGVVRP